MSQPETGGVRQESISQDRAGQRLDNFLMGLLGSVPRSLVYRIIRTGQVRVNGSRAKPMKKLKAGDVVRVPPVRVDSKRERSVPAGLVEQVESCLVEVNDQFALLDKPAGLAVHGGTGLEFGLMDAIKQAHPAWRPVHRLDRPTSGLLLLACNHQALRALQKSFMNREVEKRYLALLDGVLPEPRMRVDRPLKKIRDASGQHRVIAAEDGQAAVSVFRLLERVGNRSFVDVEIETGRTHQIRAHAASLGLPLVGDTLYNEAPTTGNFKRLFLHAHYLRLSWPDDAVYSSPLPDELDAILSECRLV
jgi:23S rRNA pseudouridine955/2504/2580 synthase